MPVQVRGVDQNGNEFSESTTTINISRAGARIALRNSPASDADLKIINLSNGHLGIFTIAFRWPERDDGLVDLGLALRNPSPDFWGIKFEDPPLGTEPTILGLIICLKCHQKVFGHLRITEYSTLSENYTFERFCPVCNSHTEWVVGLSEGGISEAETAESTTAEPKPEQPQTEAPAFQAERRRAVRYALKVPLLIIGPSGNSERTTTEDLSRTGLQFGCSQKFEIGDLVQVIVGYQVAKSPPRRTYRIVRRDPKGEMSRYVYGVMLEANQ